ncbi:MULTISPECIES: ATP-binding protein [unclassified Streptomyces]|uniref:ATP-binding protein n=1 Tax=unclassified Streptomyces TaxID=2593676 RepID=UPI001C2EADF3|nr:MULTISPECIES: ATP-binding protein [unclassified Streptomyces]MBV1949132.1 ATP-binding protein [Streptomyces sp. BV129]
MVEQLDVAPEARGMTNGRPGQLRMELELSPKTIHHAKAIAMENACLWGFDELASDVALAVAELLTNVLLHAQPAGCRGVKVARYLVQRVTGGVAVIVHDDDPTFPKPRTVDHESIGGRGLPLLSAVATQVIVTPSPPGKDVTALFLSTTAA